LGKEVLRKSLNDLAIQPVFLCSSSDSARWAGRWNSSPGAWSQNLWSHARPHSCEWRGKRFRCPVEVLLRSEKDKAKPTSEQDRSRAATLRDDLAAQKIGLRACIRGQLSDQPPRLRRCGRRVREIPEKQMRTREIAWHSGAPCARLGGRKRAKQQYGSEKA
jgi:hypothetical protein